MYSDRCFLCTITIVRFSLSVEELVARLLSCSDVARSSNASTGRIVMGDAAWQMGKTINLTALGPVAPALGSSQPHG